MRWFKSWYGANPLHLLVMFGCVMLAAYAASGLLQVKPALSGMLLLIWFPLIFRIPSHFPRTTDLSLNPYLGHWLAVTGVLFLLSAAAFALRLRPRNRGHQTGGHRRTTASQM
jgi:hypothetical protein